MHLRKSKLGAACQLALLCMAGQALAQPGDEAHRARGGPL